MLNALLFIDNNSNKFVARNGKNNEKFAKSIKLNYINIVYKKEERSFLISNTRQVFTKLRQIYIKSLTILHFDFEYYISIGINILGYTI